MPRPRFNFKVLPLTWQGLKAGLRQWLQTGLAGQSPIVLSHRRIFIIPNRRGFGLLLLLGIQLLASINYNNNLGFILTFLLGGIATLGAVYGFRNLAGLSLHAVPPAPLFVGDAARFGLVIENSSKIPRIAMQVVLPGGLPQRCWLAAQSSQTVTLTLHADRRGWLVLPTVKVFSEFPLGIFHAWSPLQCRQRVLAYPRPAPDFLPFPSLPGGGEGGERRGAEDDFFGFQSYQPGDSLRRIHWKGVAKGQGVHVKEYRGQGGSLLYLDWALTPGFDLEARLSRLCRWVLDAEKTGAVYGLRLPGVDLPPANGQAHLRQCLERLALFGLAD